MNLSKLGVRGMLIIGILTSISSVIVSVVSLADGTYKDENDSTKNTNYKTTWRFVNAILRTISLLMIVGVWVNVTFINQTDVLSTDFTWRLIIGTTIFLYLVSAVFNWVNLFISWGEGPEVHIARIVIESINLFIGLIQFWSYCTKFMASVKIQGVTDVMDDNKLYEGLIEAAHLGKDLKTTTSPRDNTTRKLQAQETAAATKEALQTTAEFGKRQKRRNPSKRKRKRKKK